MESTSLTIGWIGTGVMGKSMAKHLINKGYTLQVYNRTASKADELVSLGATFKTPVEIAKEADVLFMMLGFPQDVEAMALGENGVINHMKEGSYLIDCTTSSPGLAIKVDEAAKKRNIHSIDAPVSGGDVGA